MYKKLMLTLLGTALIASAGTAMAGKRDLRINEHQHHQRERIASGVKSGELTHDEAKDLRSDQRDLRQEERQFKSDGKLTKNERQELHQDQSAANKEIYQEKHDDQERPSTQPE